MSLRVISVRLNLAMPWVAVNFETVIRLCERDKSVCEKGTTYVLEKKAPSFIADFITKTNQANAGTLKELWYKPVEIVEQVLEKVNFPQQVLVDFPSSYNVVYYSEKFPVLLSKIVEPGDQEEVVEKFIERLADEGFSTSPLLNALKGKTFRSERLEYLATQKAFMGGVKRNRVYPRPENICEHAAITPELYADALIVTVGWGRIIPCVYTY